MIFRKIEESAMGRQSEKVHSHGNIGNERSAKACADAFYGSIIIVVHIVGRLQRTADATSHSLLMFN